jgi:hypothetical protein
MVLYAMEPLSTKMTFINGWYHCRLFNKGELHQELRCSDKRDVGYAFRYMMRWYDKMGGVSKWAMKARERHNEPQNQRTYGDVEYVRKIETGEGRGYQYSRIRTEHS